MAEFPVRLVIILSLAWLFQAAVDRWLELSWNLRAVLLILDGIAVLALLWFFVIVPFRARLDRRKAALLVERAVPKFRTSLISAVEFSEGKSEYPAGSRPLVESLLAETAREVEKEDLAATVVSSAKLKRLLKWMAGAVVLAVTAFVVAMPFSPLLVSRILLSKTAFPDETKVIDVSGDLVVIAGADALLSAKAEGVIPPSGRLVVTYGTGSSETIPVTPSRTEQGLFQYAVKNVREGFGYRFELHDGVGADHKVGVRIPPSLKDIKFTQIYPKHTGLPETPMSPASLRLLEGSKLRIEAAASEQLQSAQLEIKGVEGMMPLKVAGDGLVLKEELSVPESGWKSMSVHLTSAAGEASANDPVYRVEIFRDRVPTVVLSQPKKETITVITGAKVPFVYKISDDFGLKRAALSYRVFRPGANGDPEAAEEGSLPIKFEPAEKSISRTFIWDLS
ncbi:MAG TPA: hypothetical protein VM511_07400, partial [Luteolibacter sp.]|nr:hypothetical protein [Luteolibacter sp.]